MTCMPTTRDGFMGAVAWAVGTTIITNFDNGLGGGSDGKPHFIPKTAQQALDAVCAQVRARR